MPDTDLHWSPQYCGGAWVARSYDTALAVLRDPRLSTARAGAWVNIAGPGARREFRELKNILARTMLFTEGERHARLRALAMPAFSRSALDALTPAIRAAVETLLDAIEAGPDTFDFMRDFARPLPVRVIAHMLGIPAADCAALVGWSDAVAQFIGEPAPSLEAARAAQAGALGITAYFRDRLAGGGASRAALLDALRAGAERGEMTERDLVAQLGMFLFAGHETTRNLLGNAAWALLRHPDQLQGLRDGRARLLPALREVLRLYSPVQYTGRRAAQDLELGGQRIGAGDLVIADIDAAHRDPRRFEHAEVFRIDRNEAAPLSFGWGPHVCIGAALSYLEAQTAFEALLRRLPGLRLAGAEQWGDNPVYLGLRSLPLSRGAA